MAIEPLIRSFVKTYSHSMLLMHISHLVYVIAYSQCNLLAVQDVCNMHKLSWQH